MMCLTPVTIKNPKKVKKQGQDNYIRVPCKKCTMCMKKRARQWMFRLQKEELRSSSSVFMTYTYDNNNIPISENGYGTLCQAHHTNFMKRLRKEINQVQKYENRLKYYTVGEYGSQTERPHYHSILFNLPREWIINDNWIEDIWQKGRAQMDICQSGAIAYVTGYVNKQKYFTNPDDPEDDRTPEFSVMSKGLGSNFITPEMTKKIKNDLKPYISIENGVKLALPEYYKRKILDENELRKMSISSAEYLQEYENFSSEKQRVEFIKMDNFIKRRNSYSNR